MRYNFTVCNVLWGDSVSTFVVLNRFERHGSKDQMSRFLTLSMPSFWIPFSSQNTVVFLYVVDKWQHAIFTYCIHEYCKQTFAFELFMLDLPHFSNNSSENDPPSFSLVSVVSSHLQEGPSSQSYSAHSCNAGFVSYEDGSPSSSWINGVRGTTSILQVYPLFLELHIWNVSVGPWSISDN